MNSFGNVIRPLSWFIAVSLAAVVAGCGGGGDDSAPAAPVADATPIGNIAGAWQITETDIKADDPKCMPPLNPLAQNYPVTFTQTGNDITVTGDRTFPAAPKTLPGTIKLNKVTWSGNFPEANGTTTFNSVDTTVASDCNGLSGTSNWTYVEPTFTCTATTQFTGTRNTPVTSCAQSPS